MDSGRQISARSGRPWFALLLHAFARAQTPPYGVVSLVVRNFRLFFLFLFWTKIVPVLSVDLFVVWLLRNFREY